MRRVVGLGECSLDVVVEVDGPLPAEDRPLWPGAGGLAWVEARLAGRAPSTTLAGPPPISLRDARLLPGGQVATAMLGCVQLGLRASFLGAVGADAPAERVLEPLRHAGMDLAGVRLVAGAATRSALVLVDRSSGERAVFGWRDPLLDLGKSPFVASALEGASALLVDATDLEASVRLARLARERGIPVVLDVDRFSEGGLDDLEDLEDLIGLADFPVVSQRFVEEYSQGGDSREGLRRLCEHARSGGGGHMAVVTMGAQGALAYWGGNHLESPAFAVAARDTTGAGDAFRAGFLWALLEGRQGLALLRSANAVAALNCRARGAQAGLPRLEEVEALMEEADVSS